MIDTSVGAVRSADMAHDRIIALGLLTAQDLELLGPTFERLWPIDEAPGFSELVQAIDEADRERRRGQGQEGE